MDGVERRLEEKGACVLLLISILQDGALALPTLGQQAPKYGHQDTVDHTPHELFVEMDELEGEQWVERAR